MQLNVNYTTAYHYQEPPRRIIQLLRVTPNSFLGQSVLDWRIDVDCDARLREARDGYGNIIHMLYIDRPIHTWRSPSPDALTEDRSGVVQGLPHELPAAVFMRNTSLTETGPAIDRLAQWTKAGKGAVLDKLHRLAGRLQRDAALRHRGDRGRDGRRAGLRRGPRRLPGFHPHLHRGGAPRRHPGPLHFRPSVPARRRARPGSGPRLGRGLHPDLGWTAFDAVNGICTDDAYIRVACGLDYRDAAPVAGRGRVAAGRISR